MADRILKVDEVATMLGCEPDTVRQRTPHDLPGVKFGRDWVYVESQLLDAVSRIAKSPRMAKRAKVDAFVLNVAHRRIPPSLP